MRNDYLKIVCRSSIARTINSIEGGTIEEREREIRQTFTTFAGERSNPSNVFLEGEVTDGRMIDLAQGDLGDRS